VLIAHQLAADRAGLRLALERHGFRVCGEATDCRSAVEAALRERPDVCLVDAELPGGGIAATARIATKLPLTAIVVMAEEPGQEGLFEALQAGASGYLSKDINPERLPDVLHGVLSGEGALPRRLVATLIEEFRRRGRRNALEIPGGRAVELTGREWQVLDLLRDDFSTDEIARRLFISPGTVRTHVAAILRKLGVPDRESAVRLLR
jgi:DNA-binding NarL/FixJ family response regulator